MTRDPVLDRSDVVAEADGEERRSPSLTSIIHRISADLDPAAKHGGIPPGDIAALRRLQPDDSSSPAYWKILAGHVGPAGLLPAGGEALVRAERAWAVILNAMAHLAGRDDRSMPLGRALAQAGFSETRFVRLLRARGEAIPPAVRTTAQFLAAKAQPVNQAEFAWLVLSDGRSNAESVRRNIARSYYSQVL